MTNLRLIQGFGFGFLIAEWTAAYRAKRPGVEVLQAQIDEWMANFDARQEKVGFCGVLASHSFFAVIESSRVTFVG